MNKITCQIITIGDEILYGHILDTNSKWLSQKIIDLGITISRKTSIGDNILDINYNIKKSISNYNLTIVTGGLGPTNDDITKNCLNKIFNGKLVYDKKTLTHIKKVFKERNFDLTKKNIDQSLVPNNCIVLHNRFGTAPGMAFEKNKNILLSLPGVPFEMKSLFEDECVNLIKKKFVLPHIFHRIIKTVGIGESWLSDKINSWEKNLEKDLSLAYLPSIGRVKLRLTGKGNNLKRLKNKITKEEKALKKIIEKYIYGYDKDELESVIGKALIDLNKTVSVAESCTGGNISNLITSVPGSSNYFIGGIIAYSNEIKINSLGINEDILNKYGAVSKEVAEEMAKNVRNKFNSSIGISSTGIAGPSGGTKEKPVGTIWIAFSDNEKTISKKLILTQRRDVNTVLTTINSLNLLRKNLKID
ncbi:MAG: competence/damage-inducible protein A [Cytophagales bacterium]|nr:MAG: competence/damage-inducible protein A [Rhodothermaeota bacterium MED-G16]